MSESIEVRPPSGRVLPHELPASLRDAGLANWIREPLDDAVDRRRRIILPPAAATLGTPASAYQGALLAEARHADTVFMMGDNPALPKMPVRPVLKDFFRLRFSKIAVAHLLQSATVAREHGLGEKVITACLLHDIAIAGLLSANHGYWGNDQRHLFIRSRCCRGLRRVRGRGGQELPAAQGRTGVRRLASSAHVADDDLAE